MSDLTALSTPTDLDTLEKIIKSGDLSGLSWPERWDYYLSVCKATGLDPTTRPLDLIEDKRDHKVTLYINKEGAAQLRKAYNVSIDKLEQRIENGLCTVVAYASLPSGRRDSDIGIVSVANDKGAFRGDWLGNAIKKAVTQAKRRVTISICGFGFLDETEVDQVPTFERVALRSETTPIQTHEQPSVSLGDGRAVNPETGEVLDATPEKDPEREEALIAMARAVAALAAAEGKHPNAVRAAAKKHLGITAERGGDVSTSEIKEIAGWATGQLGILQTARETTSAPTEQPVEVI